MCFSWLRMRKMEVSSLLILPEYTLFEIMSYLSCTDKCSLSLSCRAMWTLFRCPENWRYVNLSFYRTEDEKLIEYVKRYRRYFWNVVIGLDTSQKRNRVNAIAAINLISTCHLKGLTIITAENKPLFYGGDDLIKALNNAFCVKEKVSEWDQLSDLRYVNLGKFIFYFDNATLHTLHYNHKLIEYLYLGEMSSRITKDEMICLVRMCTKLKVISASLNCFSKEALNIFTERGRTQLRHVSIKCGTNSTYSMCKDVFDSDVWHHVRNCLPSLTVGIHVDENCHFDLVKIMLIPEIPYSYIRLETFTPLYEEVHVVGKYYYKTLEKLIIHPSKERKELDESLLALCSICQKLYALHVFVLLQPETIETVLNKMTLMSKRETYTLRSDRGIGPWATEEMLAW